MKTLNCQPVKRPLFENYGTNFFFVHKAVKALEERLLKYPTQLFDIGLFLLAHSQQLKLLTDPVLEKFNISMALTIMILLFLLET